jgi:hypothetical protein
MYMGESAMVDAIAPDGWTLYEQVLPGDRLRQGDLAAFLSDDPLRQYGLVVTADCDLANRKHGRLITLVSVISLKTALEHYLLLEQLDRQRDKLIAYTRHHFELTGDLIDPIVSADLRSRVDRASHNSDFRLPCLAAKGILNDLDTISGPDFSELMTTIGISTQNLSARIANQIRDKGDLIVLPKPSFLRDSVELAWVRQIWQLPLRQIVLRNSEVSPASGMRIARLDSPFRYRATQVMGQVFSDIGTPDVARDFLPDLKGIFPT